jgi:hypothetical protein
MKPVVLAWRVTCFSCGRVLAETSSYKSANGIWQAHKRQHVSMSGAMERSVRPKIELIRLDQQPEFVKAFKEAKR